MFQNGIRYIYLKNPLLSIKLFYLVVKEVEENVILKNKHMTQILCDLLWNSMGKIQPKFNSIDSTYIYIHHAIYSLSG